MSDSNVKALAAIIIELAEKREQLQAELEAVAFNKRDLDDMTAKCRDLERRIDGLNEEGDRLREDYADLLLKFNQSQEKVSELTQELLRKDEG